MTSTDVLFSQEFVEDLTDPGKLTIPINTVEEKWRLLPAFLKTKGLVCPFCYPLVTTTGETTH
jgi:hypothetical protein